MWVVENLIKPQLKKKIPDSLPPFHFKQNLLRLDKSLLNFIKQYTVVFILNASKQYGIT